MTNYILVFGSLRKNSKRGFNYNRFGGQTYLRDITLAGFEMFNLGAYPAICEGNGTIKAELHAVTDEAYNLICRMEAGAGYDKLELNVDGKKATIFTMTKQMMQQFGVKKVASGDWN